MALVFVWLKTKLMKTNKLFWFITKTKQMALVSDWLKTQQIKTKEVQLFNSEYPYKILSIQKIILFSLTSIAGQ